ncbi:PH domain-containing protein [Granulicoccus phenolivorans]|uniref:PH domain-containing protein n=1 Tax=Granulicoccus phenolivorans TaxID=266854 RepID=UPI0003FFD994|nr:PH domain-containing protein [Granulicoccus phenolivorans]
MGNPFTRFLDPQVETHLISDEGEVVIDEVVAHPMAILPSVLGLLVTIVLFLVMPFLGQFFWVALVLGLVLFGVCLFKIHERHMNRFVVTNMRVFRVTGVFSQTVATMPMQRILDISVRQSFIGRLFGYGHFVFESAARDQGLREIRFVGHPTERDLTIQRVIQRAGIRKAARAGESW